MAVEYRALPRGGEKLSVVGLGASNIHGFTREQAYEALNYAFDSGINVIDYLSHRAGAIENMSQAIGPRRKELFLQMHFGVHYPNSQYTKNRDVEISKRQTEEDLKILDTDYIDAGFLSNVDAQEDLDQIMAPGGIWDYMRRLKDQGVIRHFGFSSHNIDMCNKLLDMGCFDLFMLSESAADDFSAENGVLTFKPERLRLFQRCQREGVGITCMKTFLGGKLLDAGMSPFGVALTPYQCIQYNLDRPAVLSCLPGVTSPEDIKTLAGFFDAPPEQKDYSVIGKLKLDNFSGSCIYCDHCRPCPAGIDIALVNKYRDLAALGDTDAVDHYRTLAAHASDCVGCRQCESRCPFQAHPWQKIQQAKEQFGY